MQWHAGERCGKSSEHFDVVGDLGEKPIDMNELPGEGDRVMLLLHGSARVGLVRSAVPGTTTLVVAEIGAGGSLAEERPFQLYAGSGIGWTRIEPDGGRGGQAVPPRVGSRVVVIVADDRPSVRSHHRLHGTVQAIDERGRLAVNTDACRPQPSQVVFVVENAARSGCWLWPHQARRPIVAMERVKGGIEAAAAHREGRGPVEPRVPTPGRSLGSRVKARHRP